MSRIPVLLGLLLSVPAALAQTGPLDEPLAEMRKSGASAKEETVHQLLELGLKEHRAGEVIAVVREWLQTHQVENSEVLYLAGVSAERSGLLDDALTYYRKVLTDPEIKPDVAARAGPALYRLLIVGRRDPDAAYVFMRQFGNRLRPYGGLRKFDPWFLAQAMRRNDLAATVERIASILNDKDVDQTAIQPYLNACLRELETFNHDNAELLPGIRKLAAASALETPQKARLLWVAEVASLNAKINQLFEAKKEVPDALYRSAAQAAENLIQVQPDEGSRLVGLGWCHFPDKHAPTVLQKATLHLAIKSPPLMKALSQLSEEQVRSILNTRGAHGSSIGVVLIPADLQKLVSMKPSAFNSLGGPDLPFYTEGMNPGQASALAPHLAKNPYVHAAVVRAVAKGNNTFTKAATYIAQNEMWRFDESYLRSGQLARFLWDCGLERDGDFRKIDALLKTPGSVPSAMTEALAKTAKPAEVKAAQLAVIQDLLSPAPSIYGALGLFDRLANAGDDDTKVALLSMLVSGDLEGDREHLLYRALKSVRMGNHWAAMVLPGPNPDSDFLNKDGHSHVMQAGKRLAPVLQKVLTQQMETGRIHEAVLGMWMSSVDPKAGLAFMQNLVSSKAWDNVDPAYLELAKRDEYFGNALGRGDGGGSKSLSRELLALPDKPSTAQVQAALTEVLNRVKAAPDFPEILGLQKACRQPDACLPFAEAILRDYAPVSLDNTYAEYRTFAEALADHLLKTKDYTPMQPVVSSVWCVGSYVNKCPLPENLTKMAEAAYAAGDYTTAMSLARGGVQNLRSREGKYFGWQVPFYQRMKLLSGKMAEAMGVIRIPVREGEAGYSIFLSQKEYMLDNTDAAWSLYDQHAEELAPVLEKLRLDYCFWVLARNVEKGEVARVEDLVKCLAVWDKRENAGFSPEQQAELKLAYADVAFQKEAFGTARAWYRKVADNQNYRGSPQYYRALLGMVAVDREEKNYDDALRTLDVLLLVKNDDLRIKAQYARALIYYAQEKYAETDEVIDAILRQDAQYADALLLRGKVQVKKRDLVSPTKIRIGMKRSTKAIEPGKHIEIELSDPSLSITGSEPIIEVEARAASGDVEHMTLRSVGGKQAIYRAEVQTALGEPRTGDKVLQVLGRDKITYGFSKRFREQMKDLPPDPEDPVEIASDFDLAISTGDFPPREGERSFSLEELGLSTADQALGWGTIRPGNPIYVRVIDPDQSRTAGKDSVPVEVRSSSGDIIQKFSLQETGPFTGEFQGAVPTASGQAVAYAYESEPGRDPNMVISPREDYPGWQGRIGNTSWKKFFAVDLNDAVALKNMELVAPETRRPTQFLVQSSMNGQQWTTVGCFPAGCTSLFDGRPQRRWVELKGNEARERGSNLKVLPEEWVSVMERAMAQPSIPIQNEYVKNFNGGSFPSANHPKLLAAVKLMHFQALFYQPEVGQRRFQVSQGGEGGKAFPGVFLIDGKPSSEEDASLIDREFKPGIHTIELWGVSSVGTFSRTELLCDDADDKMVPCPDAMFDPASFPPAIRAGLRGAATIREVKPGTYSIEFGANSQAQFVRLVIGTHAGDAPAIQRIALKDSTGRQLLPVAEDYQTLRTNQRLEVLPGDVVFVKYVDDLPYTEKRNQQEKRLTVAFNNATIGASFIQRQLQDDGSRAYEFENIRRFRMEDNVGFVITDPDMDVSAERDPVPFKVKTSDGNTHSYTAYETAAHSGVFLGKVFPITGTPQRDSEIQMTEGGTLTAIYRDMENLSPGVPADRTVTIEHAKYATPHFGVYTMATEPIEFKRSEPEEKKDEGRGAPAEVVVPRLLVNSLILDEEALKTQTPQALYNSSVRFNVIAPHLALSESSRIDAYVQTEAGRRAYAAMRKAAAADGKTMPDPITPFDIHVPGTLKVSGRLQAAGGPRLPDGYVGSLGRRRRAASERSESLLNEGRFCFSVGLTCGQVPDRSFATDDAEGLDAPSSLAVQPGDKVYIGYAFLDKEGKAQWRTATVSLHGDVFLDVMDEAYNTHLSKRFVGERVYVRVIAPALDVSPEREEVTVQVEASSGAKTPFKIQETAEHSGIFKGSFRLGFAEKPGAPVTPQEFFNQGLPVCYGDTVTVAWEKALPASFSLSVNNGADGVIESFSKRYTDSTMALEANFTLAECYFEEAKMHREMGKGDAENGTKLLSASRRKMDHAKKLLEEALASYHDPELQAHAEYLLGNLAQEYADDAENDQTKDNNYKDALARFSGITVDYPHSLFAPKAQYKKALVYEKMGQLEIAVEEYVKLGYKYPDNEFIPEAMSRIGGFFQKRGIEEKKQSDECLKKDDDVSLKKGHELLDEAFRDFRWAANVFIRLQERYPTHPLAGWAGVRGGQNRMRYGENVGAIEVFERVYLNASYDGPDVRAQAMYWAGLAHEKLMRPPDAPKYGGFDEHKMDAIALYEVIRFQFSASEWAKYARGRLASDSLSQLSKHEREIGVVNAMAALQAKMLSAK